jgi:hypothetical protein
MIMLGRDRPYGRVKYRENTPLTSEAGNGSLFQDKYGILKLAANTTLIRTPKLSRRIQWVNAILMLTKQLWKNNGMTLSDLLWIDASDFTYSIIWQKHLQKKKQE